MAKEKQDRVVNNRSGSCHCGAVRFEVELAPDLEGSRCNCSICTKTAVTSAIVKPVAFRLLTSEDALGGYAWGAKISTRFFCKHCGVHCFGRGHLAEVGGDYVGVNLNCVDGLDVSTLEVVHWDGRHDNWAAGPSDKPWPLAPRAAAAA